MPFIVKILQKINIDIKNHSKIIRLLCPYNLGWHKGLYLDPWFVRGKNWHQTLDAKFFGQKWTCQLKFTKGRVLTKKLSILCEFWTEIMDFSLMLQKTTLRRTPCTYHWSKWSLTYGDDC